MARNKYTGVRITEEDLNYLKKQAKKRKTTVAGLLLRMIINFKQLG